MRHDEDTLVEFLAGTLPPAEAKDFDAHLLGCESCWTAVREDRAGRDALESLRQPAPPQLQDRVWVAVRAAADPQTGSHDIPGRPARRHRTRLLVGTLGAVAALATAGILVVHHRASSTDPAPVAAVVALARLQAPTPAPATATTTPTPGVGATTAVGHSLQIGHQNLWLARHLVGGREVLVATSDRPFPMPRDARPQGQERHAPWLAQRDGLGLACLSQPRHMLLVGPLAPEQLLESAQHLAG